MKEPRLGSCRSTVWVTTKSRFGTKRSASYLPANILFLCSAKIVSVLLFPRGTEKSQRSYSPSPSASLVARLGWPSSLLLQRCQFRDRLCPLALILAAEILQVDHDAAISIKLQPGRHIDIDIGIHEMVELQPSLSCRLKAYPSKLRKETMTFGDMPTLLRCGTSQTSVDDFAKSSALSFSRFFTNCFSK